MSSHHQMGGKGVAWTHTKESSFTGSGFARTREDCQVKYLGFRRGQQEPLLSGLGIDDQLDPGVALFAGGGGVGDHGVVGPVTDHEKLLGL